MTNKYYVHPPGQLSRWGVVDVGLRCPHSCAHCYYAFLPDGTDSPKKFQGMRKAPWKETELLIAQIDEMADNGFLGFDLTGGEPSIHPGIEDIVKHATDRGLSSRMITLGQFLTTRNLLDRLLKAGLTDFLFSYHSDDEDVFKTMTGGSIKKMHDAMAALDSMGFDYTANAVCIDQNYRALPNLARSIIQKNIYAFNFILMNAYYEWSDGRADDVRGRYSDVAPYVREAVHILEDEGGVAVNIRYSPHCIVAGLERNTVGVMGVRYDPHEWMNTVHHSGPGAGKDEGNWLFMRPGEMASGMNILRDPVGTPVGRGVTGQRLVKAFAPQCQNCSAIDVCDGIDQAYLEQGGPDEFVPYFLDDRGKVLDRERRTYYPAHVVKRTQDAKVRDVVARLFGRRPISKNPLVSVIITNYNYGRFLEKAITSVLGQSWKNVELIVVDDASTDDSNQILNKYEQLCTVIRREQNAGNPAYGRNDGARIARGELMMCLDADDWIEGAYIEEAVRTLQRHPDASYAYPGMDCFGQAKAQFPARSFDLHQLLEKNFVPYCAVYRSEIWKDAGGYVLDNNGADDYNMWVRAALLGHYGVAIQRQLFHYNVKIDGLCETEVKPNYTKKLKHVIEHNFEIFPSEIVRWAQGKEASKDIAKALMEITRLEGSAEDQQILDYIDTMKLETGDMVVFLYRMLMTGQFRAAHIFGKHMAKANIHNLVVGLAGCLGEDDGKVGETIRRLIIDIDAMPVDKQLVFMDSVFIPFMQHSESYHARFTARFDNLLGAAATRFGGTEIGPKLAALVTARQSANRIAAE